MYPAPNGDVEGAAAPAPDVSVSSGSVAIAKGLKDAAAGGGGTSGCTT